MRGVQDLPRFELFENPVRERSVRKSRKACGVCGRARGWVLAGSAICPWCVADGTAATRLEITFNSVPDLPPLQSDDVELVEKRTPVAPGWPTWKTCCGKACVYLGQAGPNDLLEGGKWHAAAASLASCDYVRHAINRGAWSGRVCVFRCRVCSGFQADWMSRSLCKGVFSLLWVVLLGGAVTIVVQSVLPHIGVRLDRRGEALLFVPMFVVSFVVTLFGVQGLDSLLERRRNGPLLRYLKTLIEADNQAAGVDQRAGSSRRV